MIQNEYKIRHDIFEKTKAEQKKEEEEKQENEQKENKKMNAHFKQAVEDMEKLGYETGMSYAKKSIQQFLAQQNNLAEVDLIENNFKHPIPNEQIISSSMPHNMFRASFISGTTLATFEIVALLRQNKCDDKCKYSAK